MAEEEKQEETEQTEAPEEAPAAEEAAAEKAPDSEAKADEAEQAPAEEAPADDAGDAGEADDAGDAEEAPEAEAEGGGGAAPSGDDSLADLDWKTRSRILKSRESGEPGPERSPEQRNEDRLKARAAKARARRKRRGDAKAKATGEKGVGTAVAERTRTGKPKARRGLVTSDKADKTITVQIDSARRHPVYEKIVRQTHKIHVHDENNEASVGDVVRVVETRKLSKTKHWLLVDIVEKAR
ncbi:MAG: 30S ribosomal protein S17 [Solirubrobacterales bacterium]|nr:30S ribosomal protein S17 [Solirubrobacterales bacterium]